MVTRQWLWLPWNKKYGELGRKEINIARIRLISSRFAKDFIEESKDEIGRISFHLPKINDHTRSIKRKLVLVLSCSESGSKVNDTWIERTSDNAWRSAGKVEKERKKKKKIEIVVGRTIARTLDWMDFWWNFRAILSSWMMLACLYLYSMLHCFRKYLFSPRCRDSSRTIRKRLRLYVSRKHNENNYAWRLKPRDEGITIRDFHSLRTFCSFLSKNNLTNAFWETRWKQLHCCWFKRKKKYERYLYLKLRFFQENNIKKFLNY